MSDSTRAAHDGPASTGAVVAIVAPVLALGVTALSRKMLASAYRSMTGSHAPSLRDRSVPLGRVIAWAAVTGATAAVVEAVIYRATARAFQD